MLKNLQSDTEVGGVEKKLKYKYLVIFYFISFHFMVYIVGVSVIMPHVFSSEHLFFMKHCFFAFASLIVCTVGLIT